MKMLMFSIHDAKVGAFMNPFYAQSRGSAIRDFTDACNDEKSYLAKHPEDYALFEIGSFDPESGFVKSLEQPVGVITGLECVNAK